MKYYAAVTPESEDLEQLSLIHKINENDPGHISHLALNADLHKGPMLPVGTVFQSRSVMAGAVGSDIGCGMTCVLINAHESDINLDDSELRHMFFQGGRNLPLTPKERLALLQEGSVPQRNEWELALKLRDELDTAYLNLEDVMPNTLAGYVESGGEHSYDGVIGSLGGGNHFAELCSIDKSFHPKIKENTLALMIHSGSLGIGSIVFDHLRFMSVDKKSMNGMDDNALNIMNLAQNFAIINRITLASMFLRVMLKNHKFDFKLLSDLPHNFIEKKDGSYIHRKGASPASLNQWGILPGSAGTHSLIVTGLGNPDFLHSAPHGAGRAIRRQNSRKLDHFDARIIGPMDIRFARSDIKKALEARILEEHPKAYKDIETVALNSATQIKVRAKLRPILTLKA